MNSKQIDEKKDVSLDKKAINRYDLSETTRLTYILVFVIAFFAWLYFKKKVFISLVSQVSP